MLHINIAFGLKLGYYSQKIQNHHLDLSRNQLSVVKQRIMYY